jgi:hypothetical protein
MSWAAGRTGDGGGAAGSTSARGSGLLYCSWSRSRTSRSAFFPETCRRERATLIATAIAPTTSAAITSLVTAPIMKPITDPTNRNAISMPTPMAAILNHRIRHILS